MVRKVRLLLTIWLLQTAAFMLPLPLILNDALSTDAYFEAFTHREFWAVTGIGAGVVALAQALFLWRVRRPGVSRTGRSLSISVGVGAFMCAALTVAVLFALWSVAQTIGEFNLESALASRGPWVVLGAAAAAWAVWTPIIGAFCRRQRAETALSRLAARLLLGTIVEAVAIVPLDVLVRRRSDCYCFEPSFGAMLLCLGVGWFAFGPAVFLPLLTRRRKRWYAGHCDACAYDMSGCMNAERCPECGAGWRAAPDARA